MCVPFFDRVEAAEKICPQAGSGGGPDNAGPPDGSVGMSGGPGESSPQTGMVANPWQHEISAEWHINSIRLVAIAYSIFINGSDARSL
jgi:hypothetical protein